MRTIATLLAAASILFFMTSMTPAQTATTGQIVGVVTDPSGGLVVGAKVALTSDAGVRRETETGGNGRYTFALLEPGTYRMEVTSSGFAVSKLEGIAAKITESTVVDVGLKVATSQATVSVTAESPLVQTESSSRGTVIEENQVNGLPLPTRNFQQLLTLTSGTSGSLQNSSDLGRGDAAIYVNGQRSLSNSVIINGVDANSIGTGSTPNLAVPAIDTLMEFIVQTSMYDASQGRNAGGNVAAVTKSGTNAFHGDFYEFIRNTDLDANNFFLNAEGTARPTYNRNQFGGTLGGPVIKDRAWFFISYQGTRETNGTSLTNSLSTMFLPAYLGSQRDAASLAAFSVCYGLGGYVDPVAEAALQAKLPNGQYMIPGVPGVTTGAGCTPGNPGNPVAVTIPSNSTYKEDQFNTNLDVKLSKANHFFGKFFYANNRTLQALYDTFGDGNPLQAPGWPAQEDIGQKLLSLGVSSVISNHWLNEVRFGWSTIYGPGKPSQPITSSQLGISSPLSSSFPGMPTMIFPNMFTLGPSPLGINYSQTDTRGVSDTMTWLRGRHTIRFGAEYKRQALDAPYFDVFPNGELAYLGFLASAPPFLPCPLGIGYSDCGEMKDFLGGLSGVSIIGSGTNSIHNRANDFSAFLQDDWKVTPRLTLNLGLRYDFFGPTTETDGHFIGFDPSLATTTPIAISGLGTDCPATISTCGVAVTGGFVQAGNGDLLGIPKVSDGLVNSDYKNFAPRVGFAYQMFGNGKAVLRGGYGIFYDRPNMRLFNSQLFNMPYEMLATALATPNENPFVQVPQPSAFPLNPLDPKNASIFPFGGYPALLPVTSYGATTPSATFVPASGLYPDIKDWSIPYVQTYNLGVQWSFVNDWMLDVGYVGSVGRKFPRLYSFNQADSPALAGLYTVGSLGGPLFPGFGNLPAPGLGSFLMESNSNSSYNSLQVTVNKRLSKGLQALFSYTYSHSLDDYSGSDVSDVTLIPGNMVDEHNYASSDFDRRHRFVASYVYTLPNFYHGDSGIAKRLVNSWDFSGIVTMQSGIPFSLYGQVSLFAATNADLATGRTLASAIKTGNVADRLGAYFDPSAFVQPSAFGDFGQLGRNIMRGPKQINTDFSIHKLIPITERQGVEFRAEFFNLFNNVNFANPIDVAASANFGQVVATTTGPRVIQFALKYTF